MSSKDLVKQHKQEKLKSEINTIEYRLLESISFLDLVDDTLIHSLKASLSTALDELLEIKEHIINGTRPPELFKLPEGLREKMEPDLVHVLAAGRDYSGYLEEQAQYEINDMDDKEFYEMYKECFYDEDEQDKYIEIVEDIITKQQLEEVINE